MRAATLAQCGAAPALGDRGAPTPGEGELTVRVTAASITPLELLCASGTSYFGVPATPYVPGVQGVGELEDGAAVWFALRVVAEQVHAGRLTVDSEAVPWRRWPTRGRAKPPATRTAGSS